MGLDFCGLPHVTEALYKLGNNIGISPTRVIENGEVLETSGSQMNPEEAAGNLARPYR